MGCIGGAERGCGRRYTPESSERRGAKRNQGLCFPSRTAAHIPCTLMKFRYDTRYIDGYGFEMIPRLSVVFRNLKYGRELPIFCLVDSGASDVLINREIGESWGIEVERGKPHPCGGIGGSVMGYEHTIAMRLMGDTQEFTVSCTILALPSYDGLLGQRGFFDNYKVVFEKYKKTFEITAKK